jgi:hypothetical protein
VHEFAVALGAVLAACIPASTAAAYVRATIPGTQICTYWPARSIPFFIYYKGSPDVCCYEDFAAIRAAFKTWESPGCTDLTFVDNGTTTDTWVGYSAPNHTDNNVIFRTQLCSTPGVVPPNDPCIEQGGCNNPYNCWDQASSSIAVTTTTYSTDTGEIFEAGIELNNATQHFVALSSQCACPGTWSGGECLTNGNLCTCSGSCSCTGNVNDVENTVTHEVGHFLGFAHETDPTSVMFASAQPCEISKRCLNCGDIEGLCTVYPAGKPVLTCGSPPPEQVNASCGSCALGMSTPFLIFLGTVASPLMRRRAPRVRTSHPRRGVG